MQRDHITFWALGGPLQFDPALKGRFWTPNGVLQFPLYKVLGYFRYNAYFYAREWTGKMEKYGIICGADKTQEWMLPWWWSRYCDHNHFPVTFCDFGMTFEMRAWCQTKGEVISVEFPSQCITPQNQIDPKLALDWELCHKSVVWDLRKQWFKKPFACLQSRYATGIWIDLDCEILGPLEPLFECNDLALVRDYKTSHLPKSDPNVYYNGGVIVFQHGASMIKKWAEEAVALNHLFAGDDYLLSHLIHAFQVNVIDLPDIYNWRMANGLNLNAVIVHWVGNSKAYIRHYGGLKPLLDMYTENDSRIGSGRD